MCGSSETPSYEGSQSDVDVDVNKHRVHPVCTSVTCQWKQSHCPDGNKCRRLRPIGDFTQSRDCVERIADRYLTVLSHDQPSP